MSEKSGDNIFSVIKVVIIIIGSIIAIIIIRPSTLEVFGVKMEKRNEGSSETQSALFLLEGRWDMTFNFERCLNPEFANKNFECFYDIRLNQDGNKITGTGNKHSESFDGKMTKYSRDFPVKIKGEIKNEKLVANFYEQNSFDEVVGIIEVPLNKSFSFKGIYKASGENCDGNILLKRKLPRPNQN